jgi:hypothetical protein
MLLIARDERFGGGTIVVPAHEAEEQEDAWRLYYSELSVLEAPPYSPNVDLHAYFEFWERLAGRNMNSSPSQYMTSGSGPVQSEVEVPDDRLQEAVTAALREAADVASHLVTTSVKQGTVLLEGYQEETSARLAAAQAAASVPGVKEVINMLVIRAL